MDLVWIVQALIGVVLAVGAYLYKELKSKADKTHDEFLTYRTHVAESYATQPQLTRAIEAVSKTVEQMAAGVARIEERLYQQNNHS